MAEEENAPAEGESVPDAEEDAPAADSPPEAEEDGPAEKGDSGENKEDGPAENGHAGAAAAGDDVGGDDDAPPSAEKASKGEETSEETETAEGEGEEESSSSNLGGKFEEVASEDAPALQAKAVAAAGGRDPVMLEICMRLECCSCSHPVPPPIQQCNNGHLICPSCLVEAKRAKIPTCPSCKVVMKEPAMNFALAQIAKDCVVPCRFDNCNMTCKHSDYDRHLQYCMMKNKGHMNLGYEWKSSPGDDKEDPDAGIAAIAEVMKQLQCSFCAEAAPKPLRQCQNGHVACGTCLDRMRTAGNPTCPFCLTSVKETARNIHLEELAISCTVTCRYDGCGEEVKYPDLADHLYSCEHQPITCASCAAKSKTTATLGCWDAMWDHYKEKHLESATKTPLSNMELKPGHVSNMLKGKFFFITWGHSLNDNGEAVRVFPGMYYSKERETFYFTIRVMAPLGKECYGLTVTSPTSPIRMEGKFPAISYRVPHKHTINTPCLAISKATMKLMTEGGKGIRFQIQLPEGVSLT